MQCITLLYPMCRALCTLLQSKPSLADYRKILLAVAYEASNLLAGSKSKKKQITKQMLTKQVICYQSSNIEEEANYFKADAYEASNLLTSSSFKDEANYF